MVARNGGFAVRDQLTVRIYDRVGRWITRDGLKVVTIEIIKIVTTIIVTTFKRCNNLRKIVTI